MTKTTPYVLFSIAGAGRSTMMPSRCQFAKRWLIAWIALCLASPRLSAQKAENPSQKKTETADADEPVYDLDKDITPPRLVRHVDPNYDPGARGVRVAGKVVIRLIVTSHGVPKDPTVVQSLADAVDRSAIAAVQQWRFEPAKREGMPIAVRVIVEITFRGM